MKRHQASLHVRTCTHLFGRSEQHSDSSGVHGIEKHFFGGVRVGVMDESDLPGGNTRSD
jgi:hypothetical protein